MRKHIFWLFILTLSSVVHADNDTVPNSQPDTPDYAKLLEQFLKTDEESMKTKIYRCQYIAAETARRLLENFVSPAGIVAKSDEDDIVVVTDSEIRLKQIDEIMEEADRPIPQVLVEARIVEFEISDDFTKDVQLGLAHTGNSAKAENILNALGLPVLDTADYNGAGGGSSGKIWTMVGNERTKFWSLVNYLRSKSLARLLSSPNLMIRRGSDGNINTGENVPIETQTTTGSSISTSIRYENVGVKLIVRPIMISGDRIRLRINPEVSNVSRETDKGPYISLRSATTELDAISGETIIIGGLLRSEDRRTKTEVPYLSKIPLLGWFFRGEITKSVNSQLVIFVTPYVVKPTNQQARDFLQKGNMPQEFRDELQKIESRLENEDSSLWLKK